MLQLIKVLFFNLIFYFSILFFGLVFMPFLISRKLSVLVVQVWAKTIIYSLKNIINIEIKFNNSFIKEEGMIIAANHKSAFDTIYFLTVFDKVVYVVKNELKYIPVYGWYAMRIGNIFLNRSKKIESIKKLSKNINELMQNGYKIIIFPEGSRQKVNQIGEIKPGIFLLQSITKKPIFPVYINSGKTWPKNSLKIKKNNIEIIALKPIPYGFSKNRVKNILKKNFIKNDKGRSTK